ncbi:MAG: hypothetical protein EAZ16_04680 [Sphingobacteriales bacterium]|nr:MAG: hypothetical protein EAZ16_04680 [Sphingobacteriales bacterium]
MQFILFVLLAKWTTKRYKLFSFASFYKKGVAQRVAAQVCDATMPQWSYKCQIQKYCLNSLKNQK